MEYLTRSKAAFRHSVATFVEQAEARGEKPYLWTFTLRECVSVAAAFAAWVKFANRLHKWGVHPVTKEQTIVGLRVAELHPGGHGVHFHVLINRRLNIHVVRRFAELQGFFWIDVRRATETRCGRLARYLGKYLSKQDRAECMRGRRLWQAFGKWGQTRCKDIVVESEFVAAYKARRKTLEMAKRVHESLGLPYRLEGNLETMEHAREHVVRVSLGEIPPLCPHLWHEPEKDQSPPRADFADWDGAFSELAMA